MQTSLLGYWSQLSESNRKKMDRGWTTRDMSDHIDFDLLTMRALGIAAV